MTTITHDQLARPGERHPVYLYIKKLDSSSSQDTSQESMIRKLRKAISVWSGRPLDQIDRADLYAWPWREIDNTAMVTLKSRMQEAGHAPRYINTTVSAVSGVLKEAGYLEEGRWREFTIDDHQRARRDITIKGEFGVTGRALSQGEVNALIDACARDPGPAAIRDAAIISAFVACGLRIAEMAALRVGDYSPKLDQITVRRGKGQKSRKVPLVNGAGRTLRDWLELLGQDKGPVWPAIDQWETVRLNRGGMTKVGISKMLQKRQAEAAIESFTAHDLRRTCATLLYLAGVDLLVIQKYLGHRSIETTQKYVMLTVDEQAKREAASRVHIPALADRRAALSSGKGGSQ